MKAKLLSILQDKCKDFGLSEKAIEDLAMSSVDGLKSDSTDDEVSKVVDSLVSIAKLMQAEVTRKTQKKAEQKVIEVKPPKVEEQKQKDDEPEWFKAYKVEQEKQLNELKAENAAMKIEKSKAERGASILSKAKELGIPDFLVKRISIAEDADIEKELTAIKQDLVTNRLMPAESADIRSSSEQAAKDDAKSWATMLPNN